eukprot:CAMPEP_0184646036 /NCGR_PEP_ID=MMETSP0308-20130426/2688_1 /TAXON_ID=38269 /ORGANISM="Gloeochaete witrockiana, Strain SAG 46.84" /LENGTH=350 /DNA_ID=CAMNT_0027075693 /DNA_START=186 /DNA_END=1238 /DNA_ORIENTATION=+
MRPLYLVRHGERQDSVQPNWTATAPFPNDPPLTAKGIQQAEAVAGRLAGSGISVIYSSPFLRTLQTADVISRRLGIPIKIERGIGEWLSSSIFRSGRPPVLYIDSLSASDIADTFPTLDLSYHSVSGACHFPEDPSDIFLRCRTTALLLARECTGQNSAPAMIVTHAPVIQCMIESLTYIPVTKASPYCGITLLFRKDEKVWRCSTLSAIDPQSTPSRSSVPSTATTTTTSHFPATTPSYEASTTTTIKSTSDALTTLQRIPSTSTTLDDLAIPTTKVSSSSSSSTSSQPIASGTIRRTSSSQALLAATGLIRSPSAQALLAVAAAALAESADDTSASMRSSSSTMVVSG